MVYSIVLLGIGPAAVGLCGSPYGTVGHESVREERAEAVSGDFDDCGYHGRSFPGDSFNVTAQFYFRVRGNKWDGDSDWDITQFAFGSSALPHSWSTILIIIWAAGGGQLQGSVSKVTLELGQASSFQIKPGREQEAQLGGRRGESSILQNSEGCRIRWTETLKQQSLITALDFLTPQTRSKCVSQNLSIYSEYVKFLHQKLIGFMFHPIFLL